MLRSRLAKLMGFDLWPRPKEVLIAVWEKGFPLLAYRLVHPNGYMAECYLLFLQEKIKDIIIIWCSRCWDAFRGLKKLAPRLIARGWKAEGVFAGSNDTGRETPEFNVLHGELRDSHEFREALTFGENSEATSALRRAELLEFVQHNLDCANSTGVMGDCSMLQALDMPDLASL